VKYRKHFLPPAERPVGVTWYSFPVPSGADWRERVTGALLNLTYPYRWQPLPDRISVEEAAELGQETVMGWINAIGVRLTGMILPYFGATIPAGTLLCDGSVVQRAEYPSLWDVYHPWYKTEDTLTLPNLAGRYLMGVNLHDQVGGYLFEEYRHIQVQHLPPHTHSMDHQHFTHTHAPLPIPVVAPGEMLVASETLPDWLAVSQETGSTGSGQPLDIRPPCVTLRFVIIAV
jgi:microcystin-dependent protein